jgi:hypothetical protein
MPQAYSATIIFVSAGLLQPKKRDNALGRRQLYLNYGALTLATLCDRAGFPARLVHGEHEDPVALAQTLNQEGSLRTDLPLMLSMPSFYALGWAQAFCGEAKRLVPALRIVVGGRWVTGPDPIWLKAKLPEVDEIVSGLGEAAVLNFLGITASSMGADAGGAIPGHGLRHRLVDGYKRYQPSIETSRGCGMGCAFCEERSIRLTPLRAPGPLADLFLELIDEYGTDDIHPYLQSSFFLPNPRWAEHLAAEVRGRGLNVQWRCETRVDGMKPETVASLAAAGLRVIDLGLETASPPQVRAMRKASDADRYLRAASDLITACSENGVWVKANVLLYPGETADTLKETADWLDEHANLIKGISVGPVVAYGPPKHVAAYLAEVAALGGRVIDPAAAERHGISHLHLSPSISADDAEAASLALSRRHMSAQDYFDLKSFSYYPRDYDRAIFDADVAASDAALLPFR